MVYLIVHYVSTMFVYELFLHKLIFYAGRKNIPGRDNMSRCGSVGHTVVCCFRIKTSSDKCINLQRGVLGISMGRRLK